MWRAPGVHVVAFVQVEAIAEREALARRDHQVARAGRFLFEIVDAERIGGEQAVIPHMPPGRMLRVRGMIEDGDADGLAGEQPRGPAHPFVLRLVAHVSRQVARQRELALDQRAHVDGARAAQQAFDQAVTDWELIRHFERI